MKPLKLAAITLAAFALITSCSDTGSLSETTVVNTANSNPSPAAASPSAAVDELAAGGKLYADNCTICHKDDGTGGKVTIEGKTLEPDDLTSDKIKKFTDEKLIGYVTNGVPDEGMPAFKDKLSEAEIKSVVQFVRSEIQKIPVAPAD